MKRTALFASIFLCCAAWASEPDLSRIEARMQEIRSRLSLTEDQLTQLRPVFEDHFNAQMGVFDRWGLNTNEGDRRFDARTLLAVRDELNEIKTRTSRRLSDILSREQRDELEKIQNERIKHIQELILTELAEEIGAKLGLNDEQIRRMIPVLADHSNAQMAVLEKHGVPAGERGERKRLRLRKLRSLRKDLDRVGKDTSERLSRILSKGQLAEFRKIQKEQRDKMRKIIRAGARD